ncbi:MAG: DUF5663 domain-containing protein [Candidatus Moraniibacteriota bacterium]
MANQSQAIDDFINQLIVEKNFQNLDPEIMDQIKKDLAERVEDRINATILENMPPEKLEEFSALLDVADTGRIQAFCQSNILNLDEAIAQSLVNFRNIYLNL